MFTAREALVLSGARFIADIFRLLDGRVKVQMKSEDGDTVSAGGVIATVSGPVRAILAGERLALNLMQHLSGIATATNAYVKAIEGTNAKIVDTRKTMPGMRDLQKYAVRCGGGQNHRMGLYDAVLIKDNHIVIAGGVKKAVAAAKKTGTKIEVECDTFSQVEEAIGAGADIILLDNMDNATLKKAASAAKAADILTEASGNVTLETVAGIAKTGVDIISIGRLTHSVKAVDIGLDAA